MIPLAVSGTIVVGVTVIGALLLLLILLRSENRYERRHPDEER